MGVSGLVYSQDEARVVQVSPDVPVVYGSEGNVRVISNNRNGINDSSVPLPRRELITMDLLTKIRPCFRFRFGLRAEVDLERIHIRRGLSVVSDLEKELSVTVRIGNALFLSIVTLTNSTAREIGAFKFARERSLPLADV